MRSTLISAAAALWALSALPPLLAGGPQEPSQAIAAGQEGAEPLVDEAFFEQVRERLVEADRLEDFYFYRERRTEINTNPFGRLGTGDVDLYEVYPSPTRGLTYRRLVEESGVPLSDEELAEQDGEYHERAAEVRRRRDEETAELERAMPEERAEAESARAEALERSRERAREQTEDVLAAMRFTVVRREMFEGRPAIVVAFGPAPDVNPDTRRGDIARKFVGTAWIDEAEREVRYVEATSVDSISFGFGLAARISDGAAATMRREPIDDGVWMPTRVTLTGSGRAVLFLRGLSIDYAMEWFDYQPVDEVSIPRTPEGE